MSLPGALHFRLLREFLGLGAIREVTVILEGTQRNLGFDFLQDTFQLFAIRRRAIESRLLPAPFTLIPEVEKQFARLGALYDLTHGRHLLPPLARPRYGCLSD